jgi:hypothetical protein
MQSNKDLISVVRFNIDEVRRLGILHPNNMDLGRAFRMLFREESSGCPNDMLLGEVLRKEARNV